MLVRWFTTACYFQFQRNLMPLLSLGTWQSCVPYSQRHKLPLIPALWWQDLFSSRTSRAKIQRTWLKNRTNSHFSVHIDLKMPGVLVLSCKPRQCNINWAQKSGIWPFFQERKKRKQMSLDSFLDLKYFGPTEEKYETELYCRLEFQALNECEHGRESMRLKIKVCRDG